MQKLLSLIGWSRRTDQEYHQEETIFPLLIKSDPIFTTVDEGTRPTSPVSRRKPSDIYKAIDLSG